MATTTKASNGHALAVVPPTGPRVPRREVWIDLPAEYGEAGMRVRVWANYPQALKEQLQSSDMEQVRGALLTIITEHNGWLDHEGAPYPPASEPAFWDAIPDELAGVVTALAMREGQRLPNSLAAKRPS